MRLQLKLQKNCLPAGGYKVSGDTAFVHFNGAFDFKAGAARQLLAAALIILCAVAKWTWDKKDCEWLLLKEVVDSDCGYAGDERAALLQLTLCQPYWRVQLTQNIPIIFACTLIKINW